MSKIRIVVVEDDADILGMAAGQMRRLGGYFLAPGYSTEYLHIFLATDLTADPLKGDEDEVIEIDRIPLKRAYQMAEAGEIEDATTLAALVLAKPYFDQLIG